MITVIPSVYTGLFKLGDFAFMITKAEYIDALFIYNDTEECYTSGNLAAGCGNATIRPYRGTNPPRAWGIPTGTAHSGGYRDLSSSVKYIDSAIRDIKEICKRYGYTRIFYSANQDGSLGTGIFDVNTDVKNYIVKGLNAIND